MKKPLAILMLALVTILSGCGETDDVVTISTPYGDMVAILYDETPLHKQNFLKLAKEHYYDSTLFHRVINQFMIQGGDPDSKHAKPNQHLGNGGPGYTIPAEFVPKYFHERGSLAAARLNDQQNPKKESSGSQFYIVQGKVLSGVESRLNTMKMNGHLQAMYNSGKYKSIFDSLTMFSDAGDAAAFNAKIMTLVPLVEKISGEKVTRSEERVHAYETVGGIPFLDDDYTVFGKVISGIDVIDKITAVQTNEDNRPEKDIPMKVSVKKMSKKEIEKEYGYKYPEAPKEQKK